MFWKDVILSNKKVWPVFVWDEDCLEKVVANSDVVLVFGHTLGYKIDLAYKRFLPDLEMGQGSALGLVCFFCVCGGVKRVSCSLFCMFCTVSALSPNITCMQYYVYRMGHFTLPSTK